MLISEFAGSGGYSYTHSIVASFPKKADFNDLQIREFFNIKENNSQIGDIEND